MKTVFSSHSELAHVWANLTEKELTEGRDGRTSDGNCSFSGRAFYSYRTVIARHVKGAKGQTGYIFDCYGFSSSTSKHQSHVARAVGYERQNVFRVRMGNRGQSLNLSGKELFQHYVEQAENMVERSQAPRLRQHTREGLLASAIESIREANRAREFFGLRCKPAQENTDLLKNAVAKRTARHIRAAKLAEKVQRETEARRTALCGKILPLLVALWRQGQEESTEWCDLTAQLADEGIYQAKHLLAKFAGYPEVSCNALLRLTEDQTRVETTQGAQVLVRTVKFLWPFCAKAQATKTAVPAEIISRFPRLDHYQAEAISENGDLKAGCHRIPFGEVQRIAQALSLPPFNAQEAAQCVPAIPATATDEN